MLTTMYWWVPYCPIAEHAGKMGRRQPRVGSCVLSGFTSDSLHSLRSMSVVMLLISGLVEYVQGQINRWLTPPIVQTHQMSTYYGCSKPTFWAFMYLWDLAWSSRRRRFPSSLLSQDVQILSEEWPKVPCINTSYMVRILRKVTNNHQQSLLATQPFLIGGALWLIYMKLALFIF